MSKDQEEDVKVFVTIRQAGAPARYLGMTLNPEAVDDSPKAMAELIGQGVINVVNQVRGKAA